MHANVTVDNLHSFMIMEKYLQLYSFAPCFWGVHASFKYGMIKFFKSQYFIDQLYYSLQDCL